MTLGILNLGNSGTMMLYGSFPVLGVIFWGVTTASNAEGTANLQAQPGAKLVRAAHQTDDQWALFAARRALPELVLCDGQPSQTMDDAIVASIYSPLSQCSPRSGCRLFVSTSISSLVAGVVVCAS